MAELNGSTNASTDKRSNDVLMSPEMQPKDAKKIRIKSPKGLAAMIALPTALATINIEETMEQFKEYMGRDVTTQTLKAMKFVFEKQNQHMDQLQKAMDYIDGCYSEMEDQHADLQRLVQGMSKEVDQYKSENSSLKLKLDDQVNNSRRKNIIIRGIPEVRGQNTENFVREFLKDFFNAPENLQFESVHRLGRENSYAPRPIIVRFAHLADRDTIWNSKWLLARSKFFLDEDFSPEVQKIRRKLLPVMAEAKRKSHRCNLVKDKLIVDGVSYTIETLKNLPKEIRDGSRWHEDQVAFFGELCPASNFHSVSFKHDGRDYENSEKALFYKKAVKFGDKEAAKKILAEKDPRTIKAISKTIKNVDDSKWKDSIKELVTPILVDKFSQNDHMKEWLKSTGTRQLVEAAGPHDKVWGNGLRLSHHALRNMSMWTGENFQGDMLMSVRRKLCPEVYEDMDTYSSSSSADNSHPPASQISSSQGFIPEVRTLHHVLGPSTLNPITD